mmetsp:Transcript_38013/g.90300  ORF Transcript_38013/g.90300 Transcript_38013/m.90300 type:complete len:213 (+) Transcript_38013:551-1189(+)
MVRVGHELRGHVRERPAEIPAARDVCVVLVLGEAEVGDLHDGGAVDVAVNEEVVRLEVKVHDAELVQVAHPIGGPERELRAAPEGEPRLVGGRLQERRQRPARHVLRDDPHDLLRGGALDHHAKEADDVGVVEAAEQLRLLPESSVVRPDLPGLEPLDGDLPKDRDGRERDLPKGPLPDLVQDLDFVLRHVVHRAPARVAAPLAAHEGGGAR